MVLFIKDTKLINSYYKNYQLAAIYGSVNLLLGR